MRRRAELAALASLAIVRALASVSKFAITAALVAMLPLAVAPPAAAENLARGIVPTWSPAPNYERCTDAGDRSQLGDGARAASEYIWLDKATVGWALRPGDVVTLVFDLGRTCAFDSVVVRTAAFAPAQIVPPSLVCAVADSANRYAYAGGLDAATLAPADPTRAVRVSLAIPLGGARGRYVLLAALLRDAYFFSDEIEIHGSSAAARLAGARAAKPASDPLGRAFGPHDVAAVGAAQRRLWAARAGLPRAVDATATATSGAAEEAARFAARAAAWRAAGKPPLRVQRVDPWAASTPWSDLQSAVADTLHVWPGAWSAAAIEIASAAPQRTRVALALAPPAAGAPRATLREVIGVEARDGRWVNDALPLAPGGIDVEPGQVRQVWVDVDARDARPGAYTLRITAGATTIALPVRCHALRLAPPPLVALDWTYPQKFALTRAAATAALQDNRAHGIDTWWFAEESVPWPDRAAIDAQGHVTRAPNWTACDAQLALHDARTARRLGWYWNFDAAARDPSRGAFAHPYLSPAWRRAVSEWLALWIDHLRSAGYEPARIVMQPVDERSGEAVARLYGALHVARPDLRLALTVTRLATAAELRALQPALGLAIVEREALQPHADWLRDAAAHGTEVWSYDVLEPSKSEPPETRYRLLPWEAWARGLSGCGFWCYGDTGTRSADAWNDFDDVRCDDAAVYGPTGAPRSLGDEAFAPSKRWQAFRIGLQETALLEAALARQPRLRQDLRERFAHDTRIEPEALRRRLLVALP